LEHAEVAEATEAQGFGRVSPRQHGDRKLLAADPCEISISQRNIHHRATEALRRTKAKAKLENTEVAEATEARFLRVSAYW